LLNFKDINQKPSHKTVHNIYSFLAFSTWSLTYTKNFDFTAGGNTLNEIIEEEISVECLPFF